MDKNIKPEISLIICTHNPRMDYLERVLEPLQGQSFSLARWELLLIDNKSDYALAERVDLSWHPQARVVREEELGLTRARLRGIAEARGELLVFVDDDNVLRADYLEQAIKISMEWPKLGAWSGRVVPEYEAAPAEELKSYIWRLCIREVKKDVWGNEGSFDSTPWGAGMCVRKVVAEQYAKDILINPIKALLDRRGKELGSAGDVDLALTSHSLHLGTGVFTNLEVLHIIGARRVQKEYLLKLIEDGAFAYEIFLATRLEKKPESQSGIDHIVARYKLWRASSWQRKVAAARNRGRKRALEIMRAILS